MRAEVPMVTSEGSNTDFRRVGDVSGGYEFRVWGEHRQSERKLEQLSTTETVEEFQDCYLLGPDRMWNAKIRNSTLKVKRHVRTVRGFQQWDANWHTEVDSVPSPLDDLFERLSLDRPQRGKRYDLARALNELEDSMLAVFVAKRRQRFRLGSVRAEVADLRIEDAGIQLHSLAIEGDDLKDLVALRRELGLDNAVNVAIHVALEHELQAVAGGD